MVALSVETLDMAIEYILQESTGAHLAKNDIKGAFCKLSRPADMLLLSMKW